MKQGLLRAGQIIYSVPRLKNDSQVHFHRTFSPRKVCRGHWTVFSVAKKMFSKFSSVSQEMLKFSTTVWKKWPMDVAKF